MKKYSCSIEVTMDIIGGKWKCLILHHLSHVPQRTSQLRRLMPSITQKMLVQQLRELEEDGIVLRTMYNQVPPKVEYSLTEFGTSIVPLINSLCVWGDDYIVHKYGDKSAILTGCKNGDSEAAEA
jgi:DNA-binding HxlR family transcriptional regulator